MINPKTTSATVNLCLFAIAIIVLWGYALKTSGGAEAPKPKPKPFQIVNQYNGCNVVRYETSHVNPRYAYILDCKNSKERKP
jgi:hypothetical protein